MPIEAEPSSVGAGEAAVGAAYLSECREEKGAIHHFEQAAQCRRVLHAPR